MEMSDLVKAELVATCSHLGRQHDNRYILDPQCQESVRDLILFLRRDDPHHAVRLHLGAAKIVENDLVPIIVTVPHTDHIFDLTIRLLVNLTHPAILLFKEEIPTDKIERNVYMNLLAYSQEYKTAFCSVDFWKSVCAKLTDLFEVDWAERSEDSNIEIERLLVLLRNVLQVPADSDLERRPDNDITVHDKVLWALRESRLLELLLYVSSNRDEQQFYLLLLECFSLILREQSATLLANCEIRRSTEEKLRDSNDLARLREKEKLSVKSFKNARSFRPTFVLKNVKSLSNNEIIYHKSLDKLNSLQLTQEKKRLKTPKTKFPEDSERIERRSTFSVRLFLKEFCVEFLSCSFNSLMAVVKEKLDAGRTLSNDESYYFWALKFFLEFSCTANVDIKLFSECINVQTFHFIQTRLENGYDHLATDKKKTSTWVRRLHLTLKAYRSLLQTLVWMDASQDAKIRETSRVIKSNVFYVVEYRELLLNCLFKYDSGKNPLSFLRDLIETNHMNLKLLENYCKTNEIVVQRRKRVFKKRAKRVEPATGLEIWEKIHCSVLKLLEAGEPFPDIAPFDAASDVAIDDQKEDAMKNIQKFLRADAVESGVGLLRSARLVWPDGNFFGFDGMSVEEELLALQQICEADLGVDYRSEDSEESDEEDEETTEVIEHGFDVQDYVKKLVNKKVVEGCCTLLGNYRRNTPFTNHCVIKLLHRIGWDCKAPAMLYQASFFLTLHKILSERAGEFKEAQNFAKQLIKKFRENFVKNPKIFMEILFWKDAKTALEVESNYQVDEEAVGKTRHWSEEEEDELRRLWVESESEADRVEWIRGNLINASRSRQAVGKKLKEMLLLLPGRKRRTDWTEEEVVQLGEIYREVADVKDAVGAVKERLQSTRTKKVIKEKLIELGLIATKKPKPVVEAFSETDAREALSVVRGMKAALEWLKETFEDCLQDPDVGDGYPLLAVDSEQTDALDDPDFQKFLGKLGFSAPGDGQVYWKIRLDSKTEIEQRLGIVSSGLMNDRFEEVEEQQDAGNQNEEEAKNVDDEDEEEPFWRHKRRRCIGSDSEIEDNPSDEDVRERPKEVRKKSRMLDSDSDSLG